MTDKFLVTFKRGVQTKKSLNTEALLYSDEIGLQKQLQFLHLVHSAYVFYSNTFHSLHTSLGKNGYDIYIFSMSI